MSNPFLHSYFCYPRPLMFGALIAWTLACGVFGWLIGTAQRRRTPNYTELIIRPMKEKASDSSVAENDGIQVIGVASRAGPVSDGKLED